MKVTTTMLKNINEKEMYYITIAKDDGSLKRSINVGKKTFDSISEMIEDVNLIEQAQLDLQEEEQIRNKKSKK